MIRKSLGYLLKRPFIAKRIVNTLLFLHQKSYHWAGRFSMALEKDGLHPKHRLMQYHKWFEQRVQKNWDLLDVGCGVGALSQDLIGSCKSIKAIDIDEKNIKKAPKNIQGIDFLVGDATKYNFGKTFDAIVMSNVLEHIEDRVKCLKDLKKLTKRFLIRVPMIDREWIVLYKKERGLEYLLDPTHFTEYTMEQFVDETKEAGLEIVESSVRFGEIYAVLNG